MSAKIVPKRLKGSSPATATADFRISGKLIWAPPRHHRILKLDHIYHNSGWGKFLSQCSAISDRFKIALPNCVQLGITLWSLCDHFGISWYQLGISWVSVGDQLVSVGDQLGITLWSLLHHFVITKWCKSDPQLIPNWSQSDQGNSTQ